MINYIDFEDNMYTAFNGLAPVAVKGQYNKNNYYQKKYLLNQIYSRFTFKIPEDWDLNTLRFTLFVYGNFGIFKKNNINFFSLFSTKKWNQYYNPSVIDSEPFVEDLFNELRVENAEVGKDCCIVKCFDNYRGFNDLLNDYSNTLAEFDKSIKTALMNGNIPLMGFAKDKKQAEEIRNAYAVATNGEPLVILDKSLEPEDREKLLIPLTSHDTTSIVDKLLNSRRMVINNFLTQIGIENANINKKERLVTDEVNANNEEVVSVISCVYENIKKGFDEANRIFNLDLDVKLNIDKEEEGKKSLGGEENE